MKNMSFIFKICFFLLVFLFSMEKASAFPPPGASHFVFFKPLYIVNIAANGTGTGTFDKSTSFLLEQGSSVAITATPNADSNFVDWKDCDNYTGNVCNITNISAPRTVTATFNLKTFNVAVNVEGSGSVIPGTSQTVSYGGSANFSATAADGWEFVNWSGDIPTPSNDPSILLTGITRDMNLNLKFIRVGEPTKLIKVIISWEEKTGIKTLPFSSFVYKKD